jgi:hypothetical protein
MESTLDLSQSGNDKKFKTEKCKVKWVPSDGEVLKINTDASFCATVQRSRGVARVR